jgi:Flp pilus assembly protein TadB
MKLEDLTKQDIIALIPVLIGSILVFTMPENMGDIFANTAIAVILIKLFW